MRRALLLAALLLAALLAAWWLLPGQGPQTGGEVDEYQQVLERLARKPGVAPDSEAARAALERFRGFYSELRADRVRQQIRELYAEDVWFNDTLKTVRGVDALEQYFLDTVQAVESTTVKIHDVAHSDGNFYVRWSMVIRFKSFAGGRPTHSIGVSQLRLDEHGRVVMHQDFWDSASGFYQHLPLLGRAIRAIRARL